MSDKRVHIFIVVALLAAVAMLSYVAVNTEFFGAAKGTLAGRLRGSMGDATLSARLRSVDGSPALSARLRQIQEMGEHFRYGAEPGSSTLSARLREATDKGMALMGENDKSMVVNGVKGALPQVDNRPAMMKAMIMGHMN